MIETKSVELIIGAIVAYFSIKYSIDNLKLSDNKSLISILNNISNYGLGILTGTIINFVTQSPVFTLVGIAILYSSKLLNIRQVNYVMAGAAIGNTFTGMYLVINAQYLCFSFIEITIVYLIIQKYRKNLIPQHKVKALMWFSLSIISLHYFKKGMSIVFDFVQLPAVLEEIIAFAPFLTGTLISVMTQSYSASMGIILSLVPVDLIEANHALIALSSVAMLWPLHLIIIFAIIEKKSLQVFLGFFLLSLLNTGISFIFFDHMLAENLNRNKVATIMNYHLIITFLSSICFAVLTAVVFRLAQNYKKI